MARLSGSLTFSAITQTRKQERDHDHVDLLNSGGSKETCAPIRRACTAREAAVTAVVRDPADGKRILGIIFMIHGEF